MQRACILVINKEKRWPAVFTVIALLLVTSMESECQLKAAYLFKFDKLSTGNKPINQSIICIAQDPIGFVWFGTANGLYRYDGINFEAFEFEELKNVDIYDLLVDSEKNLWIATTWEQLYKYDVYHHTLTHYIYDSASLGTNNTMVYKICEGQNHILWLASKAGLMSFNASTKKFANYFKGQTRSVHIYHDTIWVGMRNEGVRCFSAGDGRSLQTPEKWLALDGHTVNCIYHDKVERFWIGTNLGLFMQNSDGLIKNFNNNKKAVLPDNSVSSILEDDDPQYTWISTDKGIGLYDAGKEVFVPVQNNDNAYTNMIEASSNCLFKDAAGKIWIGTLSEGIYSFYPRKIKAYQHHDLSSIHSDDIKKIFLFKTGVLALIYNDGIDLIDPQNEHCQFYPFHNPIDLAQSIIQSSSPKDDSSIFIGSRLGLFSFQIYSHAYTASLPPKINGRLAYVNAAIVDGSNALWIGLEEGGLYQYLPMQKTFREFGDKKKGVWSTQINQFSLDRDGGIILSHFSGFQKYLPAIDSFLFLKKENKIFFTSAGVCYLTASPDISIGGSYQQGVFFIDKDFNEVRSIDETQGIGSNTIWSFLLDKKNTLWVTTSFGINKIKFRENNLRNDYEIIHFDKMDGLPGEIVVNMVEQYIDNHDEYYLATNHGLVEAKADAFQPDAYVPPVVITSLNIANKRISPFDSSHILSLPVYLTHEVNLSYIQNSFQVTFAALDYINSQKNLYAYMLQGIDKKWIFTSSTSSAAYSNLSPGDYTFLVKAANGAGKWNEKPSSLHFIIRPPFWKTIWAYLSYSISLILILYWFYRNRIEQLNKKQSAQLHTMVATQEEERKRISRDLHDDVGTKLSALKLYISSLKNNIYKGNYKQAEILSANAEDLINETMKDVREMLLNLSPNVLEEFGYATAVEGLVSKINEARVINFNLVLFGLQKSLPKEYELALYRITQELINNVLKHSGAKNVSLQIGYRDQRIVLMIDDDGKGFDLSAQRNGYGLKNLEARTKLLSGVMNIDARPGNGTRVLIEIPFQY